MASWLVRQGIISVPLAHDPECTGLSIGDNPIITSPEHKAIYYVQSGISTDYQKTLFEASTASDSREVHWFLDGQLFATSITDARVFYRPQHGDHRLMCVDTYGRSTSVAFRVE